ncbi:MAG TPA: class I SAM-dependent methyltransferase [Chloroflexota bacterium]|nr:class I SAM-dependent methyltransferase [Chloroflexota bacterium]
MQSAIGRENPLPSETVTPTLHATRCAICGTKGAADEVWPPRLGDAVFNAEVFSARRLPDRLHYRLVRCTSCGLVRSDPVASADMLANLYRESTFDYGEEVASLNATYGRYLARASKHAGGTSALLEVGCGNGFFLEEALHQGWATVWGVEPSTDAIARAPASIQAHIKCDVMRPGLFEPEMFDAICFFQVMDHLPDPAGVLRHSVELLRSGGVVLCLNHNVTAWSARLLGERSPIVDVEHTYLYSPDTMRQLLEGAGLRVVEAGAVWNTYSVSYLVHLPPLPRKLKQLALKWLERSAAGRLTLRVPLGNQYVIARRER